MKYIPNDVKWHMMTNARSRARRGGLPFDLDYPYLHSIWPEDSICPVFKFEMKASRSGKPGPKFNSPTLDRIIPSKGYVKGNVIVISNKANLIKNEYSPKDMYQVADFFYELIN